MPTRLNRDPAYDLTRHLITGEKPPLSGEPTLRDYDAELDRNDPMDPITAGVGDNFVLPRTDGDINQMNLTAALGMDSGDGKKNQVAIDMQMASNCEDEPSKGGLSYGPRNTGGY